MYAAASCLVLTNYCIYVCVYYVCTHTHIQVGPDSDTLELQQSQGAVGGAVAGTRGCSEGGGGKGGKERLALAREECRDALRLLLDCTDFTTLKSPAAPEKGGAEGGRGAGQGLLAVAYGVASADAALLLKLYATLGLKDLGKSAVLAAFDASLKTLKALDKVRSLCGKGSGGGARGHSRAGAERAGAVPESLSILLVMVSHALLAHIVGSFAADSSESELVSWLVFGCSFINVVMALVGDIKVCVSVCLFYIYIYIY